MKGSNKSVSAGLCSLSRPFLEVRTRAYERLDRLHVVKLRTNMKRWKDRCQAMELRVVFRLLIQRPHGLHAPHRGVVELVHFGQVEGLKQPELGEYLGDEHLRQVATEGVEDGKVRRGELGDIPPSLVLP